MWRNWQTRTVQVRVNASSWGFESLHPHQIKKNGLPVLFYIRVIGQNVLVKTAATIEISMDAAVISFFREDIRWTKRVGKILGIC